MAKNTPFSDITVLDFSRYLPGGYATQVLADLGATVIKVEDTGLGDFMRHDYPTKGGGISYYITALGRNKKSVSLNLKNEEVVDWFLKMAQEADIIVESFRPGVTAKLGIDYESIKKLNPGIIYCSISGYGANDPRSKKAQHDLNMQATSGYLSVNHGSTSPLHLCDLSSGMVAGQALLTSTSRCSIASFGGTRCSIAVGASTMANASVTTSSIRQPLTTSMRPRMAASLLLAWSSLSSGSRSAMRSVTPRSSRLV